MVFLLIKDKKPKIRSFDNTSKIVFYKSFFKSHFHLSKHLLNFLAFEKTKKLKNMI